MAPTGTKPPPEVEDADKVPLTVRLPVTVPDPADTLVAVRVGTVRLPFSVVAAALEGWRKALAERLFNVMALVAVAAVSAARAF